MFIVHSVIKIILLPSKTVTRCAGKRVTVAPAQCAVISERESKGGLKSILGAWYSSLCHIKGHAPAKKGGSGWYYVHIQHFIVTEITSYCVPLLCCVLLWASTDVPLKCQHSPTTLHSHIL
jgi:hypothetical protein